VSAREMVLQRTRSSCSQHSLVPIPANAQVFIHRRGERSAIERSVPNSNSIVLIGMVEFNSPLLVRSYAKISTFPNRNT
jgi:hypothetical protein